MKKLMKKKKGFSLAEALITLLIVCLITVASIPVITKKHRDKLNQPHGVFACYWDENDNLVARYLVQGSSSDGSTEIDNQEGRRACVFNPPAGAKNFVVTIVGGGGGGAAAAANDNYRRYTGGTSQFTIPATGFYDAIVMGGGGGGGGSNAYREEGEYRGGGGSGGGIAGFYNRKFSKDSILTIVVGGAGDRGGDSGGDRGNPGSQSYITHAGSTHILGGGGGGGAGQDDGEVHGWRYKNGSWQETVDTNFEASYSGPGGNAYCISTGGGTCFSHNGPTRSYNGADLPLCKKSAFNYADNTGTIRNHRIYDLGSGCVDANYNNFIQHFQLDENRSSYDTVYGSGGRGEEEQGGSSHDPRPGTPGIAVIHWYQVYAGLGGKAGNSIQIPYAELPQRTFLFPGKGGKGGVILDGYQNASTPGAGETSFIKNGAPINGGSGAIKVVKNSSGTYNITASGESYIGGNGELANINPAKKSGGAPGGRSPKSYNNFIDNNSQDGQTLSMFYEGFPVATFSRLIGAGSGGGGGSAQGNTIGGGGKGASGIVFIQW